MVNVKIDSKNYPMMLLGLLVDLHAKQDAQTTVLVDFLSSVSNKKPIEIINSLNTRTQRSKSMILENIYAEFGGMPDDIKKWFEGDK